MVYQLQKMLLHYIEYSNELINTEHRSDFNSQYTRASPFCRANDGVSVTSIWEKNDQVIITPYFMCV